MKKRFPTRAAPHASQHSQGGGPSGDPGLSLGNGVALVTLRVRQTVRDCLSLINFTISPELNEFSA